MKWNAFVGVLAVAGSIGCGFWMASEGFPFWARAALPIACWLLMSAHGRKANEEAELRRKIDAACDAIIASKKIP